MTKTIRMPGTDQLNTAIAWLRCNEGDNGEAENCQAVADWIEYMEREAFIRSTARSSGVTAAEVRRKLEDLLK